MKFHLNLFELSFLGKELYTVSINYYPMLILEFLDGYYTTNELFEKNNLLDETSQKKLSNDLDENLNIGSLITDNLNDSELNEEEVNNSYNKRTSSIVSYKNKENSQKANGDGNKWVILENENKNKKRRIPRSSAIIDYNELKKAQIQDKLSSKLDSEKEREREKKKEKEKKLKNKNKKKSKKINKEIKEKKIVIYKFEEYFHLYLEKILFFSDTLNAENKNTLNNKNSNIKFTIDEESEQKLVLFKRKQNIDQIQKQIEFYKNKDNEMNKIKSKLISIISNKRNLIEQLNKEIKIYNNKYEELKKNHQSLIPTLAKRQMLHDSFLYKKMAEICFVFFNKQIKKKLIIPDFLKKSHFDMTEINRKRAELYNNKDKKRILSSLMGNITYLMVYMSKCFDIPLKYPLYLNGSKSFISKGKKDKDKDFIPLHCDSKKDEKCINFEIGLNILKYDFKEIMDFLSMYPEIISDEEYSKFNMGNDDYMFFDYFICFYNCLKRLVKNIEETYKEQ